MVDSGRKFATSLKGIAFFGPRCLVGYRGTAQNKIQPPTSPQVLAGALEWLLQRLGSLDLLKSMTRCSQTLRDVFFAHRSSKVLLTSAAPRDSLGTS
jgi:hypothetical protein